MRRRIHMVAAGLTALLAGPRAFEARAQRSQVKGAGAQSPAAALKRLRRHYDEMTEVATYSSREDEVGIHRFALSFKKPDAGTASLPKLSIVVVLFTERSLSYAWAKFDGVNVDVPRSLVGQAAWGYGLGGGDYFALSSKELFRPEDIAFVRKLSSARNATIRFEDSRGGHMDMKFEAKNLQGIRHFIAAYEAVTGMPWK